MTTITKKSASVARIVIIFALLLLLGCALQGLMETAHDVFSTDTVATEELEWLSNVDNNQHDDNDNMEEVIGDSKVQHDDIQRRHHNQRDVTHRHNGHSSHNDAEDTNQALVYAVDDDDVTHEDSKAQSKQQGHTHTTSKPTQQATQDTSKPTQQGTQDTSKPTQDTSKEEQGMHATMDKAADGTTELEFDESRSKRSSKHPELSEADAQTIADAQIADAQIADAQTITDDHDKFDDFVRTLH